MQLHTQIKKLRQFHGKSQDDAADALKVNQSTYSKIETGKVDLTVKQLYILADFFETTVHDILEDGHIVFHLSKNHNANGVVINHQKMHKDERKIYEDYINSLKGEINNLKEINTTFKNIIDKKLN